MFVTIHHEDTEECDEDTFSDGADGGFYRASPADPFHWD
ncbi:hypothetical protein [Vibrio phage pTD1]|uniref:Uncharacterized protein n=1 Tax=Vibrio phage pTD1 TaxID=1938577 RepID=A0A1Q2U300_9CAUD|nr:hypothetical protein FDH33_gp137 [Vibrio phage pTD1]BAW98346.1 hypothetical protein [Vibrio phage pTD1]